MSIICINRVVIAKNIKKIMKQKRITQIQLGMRMHLDQSAISKMLSGTSNSIVNLEALAGVAEALDCSVEDFLIMEESKYVKENE